MQDNTKYTIRPHWLYMTYETKKWKDTTNEKENQIGEKTRILSANSKLWRRKRSKYFDNDLHQVVLSAHKKKRKKSKILKWTWQEEKRYWIEKTSRNKWKRICQLDWIIIICLAIDFVCLQPWCSLGHVVLN